MKRKVIDTYKLFVSIDNDDNNLMPEIEDL